MPNLQKLMMRGASALNVWVYRRSAGKWLGRFPSGAPVCLVTTKGRKSGQRRTVPLLYLKDGDDLVIVASQGGAPEHPGWYRNLEAQPNAKVEIGRERFPVVARRVSEDEKARLCRASWRSIRWGGRPRGIRCQGSPSKVNKEPSMNQMTRIAIDTSKSVFTLHGVDAGGRPVLRRNLRRQELQAFFEKLPSVEVVLEACGGRITGDVG